MTSMLAMRLYAWFQILTLPPRFFASEFFMWNRDQLRVVMRVHRVCMTVLVALASYMIGDALIAQYRDGYVRENQVVQMVKELDRQDNRIDRIQNQVNDINIQMARLASGQETLTNNMRTGMSILGAIGLVILGQFATYVVNLKMRREYNLIEKREGR